MLLQSHQQLDVLREEDASLMTTSGEANLFSADFKNQKALHPHGERRSSRQEVADSTAKAKPTSSTTASAAARATTFNDDNNQLVQSDDKESQMKPKRKTSVFDKLGKYKFRKSVPQCGKQTRSSSWTGMPVDSVRKTEVESFQDTSASLCDGFVLRTQEIQRQNKQVHKGVCALTRNCSLNMARSKSNSLPVGTTMESHSYDRLLHPRIDGSSPFQHVSESDTAEDSDVNEDSENCARSGSERPSNTKADLGGPTATTQSAGHLRWKKVANKFGIDTLKRAFKDGLASPSHPTKSLTRALNQPYFSYDSSVTGLLAGQEMADSNSSITLTSADNPEFKFSKSLPHHTRRASVAVDCVKESSSSSSSPFLLSSSSSSSLQQQGHLNVGQLLLGRHGDHLAGDSSQLSVHYDSDGESVKEHAQGKGRHWHHRNSFQSIFQFPQQQLHLQQLHQQQLQQQFAFHESLQKIAALDVSFLDQSEAEYWSLTVPSSKLAQLSEREIKFQNHVWELIQTEKNHFRTLLTMQKVFVEGLIEEVKMSERMIDKLFPALYDLVFLHYPFLTSLISLQDSLKDKIIFEIGPTLTALFSGSSGEKMKSVYGDFCTRHSEALQVYKESLKNDAMFQRFIKKCSFNPLCKRLTVPECILLVAQRPTKYPLLIEPILDTAQKDSTEHDSLQRCLTECRTVLDEINREIASKSRQCKLNEICNRIDSKASVSVGGQTFKKSDIFCSQRKLILEGCAKLVLNKNKQQDVYTVLLSDVLVFLLESGQKLTFFSQENKTNVISLRSLLVREKADSRDGKGLYLICLSDSSVPEMLEFSFKSAEDRNRWSTALKEAISLNSQKAPETDAARGATAVQPRSAETATSADQPCRPVEPQQQQQQQQRKSSVFDGATIGQLQSLVEKLRMKDSEISHNLEEKLKTFTAIARILAPDDNCAARDQNVSLQEWMNIAFTEGTKLLGISAALSPKSLGSVDSCLSRDFDDSMKEEAASGAAAATATGASPLLPKRAETFAGFDSRKTSREGKLIVRPNSATLTKKMAPNDISNSNLKHYDQDVNTPSSSAMQSSMCSTTSGVRSSSFEGQSSSFECQGQILTPSQCSSVKKLLSAVQKISTQAMAQMTEIQSLKCQLAEAQMKMDEGKRSTSSNASLCRCDEFPSSISAQFPKSSFAIVSSATKPAPSAVRSDGQTAVQLLTTSTTVCTSTVTMVSSFSSFSPTLTQERVKVVRPTFLPFSPLKFHPIFTKQPPAQGVKDSPQSSSSLLPSTSSSPSATMPPSPPAIPQSIPPHPNRHSCQSSQRKSLSFSTADSSKFLGIKRTAFNDLSIHENDDVVDADAVKAAEEDWTSAGDELSNVSLMLSRDNLLYDSIVDSEIIDNHLNIADPKITILIDSCPIGDDGLEFFNDSRNNNFDATVGCCRSCEGLYDMFTTNISSPNNNNNNNNDAKELYKSLSTQAIAKKKPKNSDNNSSSTAGRESSDRCRPSSSSTSLSLYFK